MSEVVIKIYRGNLIENLYRGDVSIVNKNSNSIYSLGDEQKLTYWRSAAKPIQALPIIFSGAYQKYNFTNQELAIMAASHNGEEKHIRLVYSILEKINLSEKDLKCGICPPVHRPTAYYLKKNGIKISPVYNPCSGKHVAQLALCKYYGWSIADYYSVNHPVQQMILDIVGDISEYPKRKIYLGIDDCTVPVFGMPIKNMSKAYARIANWELLPKKYKQAVQKIFSSMVNNPDIVGGTDRFDTDLMKVSDGNLLAKSGADGVFCIGIRNEKENSVLGITIKMESGNMKFLPMAVIRILEQIKILSEKQINKLKNYIPSGILNFRDEKIGFIISDFKLKEFKGK
ncbi:MAG: asparaginase [Atribacterota bacterium]